MTHPARHNRYLNTMEMRRRRTVVRSRPYSIQLEVTTKCNLACIMCARDKYHGRGRHLDDDILARFLEELLPTAQDVIVSSFGEPLLYPKFGEIAARIDPDSGLELGFFTNLLVLTEEMAEHLVRSGVGYINVSIDGATKETYERIRAGGRWETLIEKIELLNAVKCRLGSKKPRMNLCVVGSTLNIEEAPLFVEFARQHGFDSVKYNPNMYVDDEEMEYLSLVHEQGKAVRMFEEAHRRAVELDMHTNFHMKPYKVDPDRPPEKQRSADVPAGRLLANRLKQAWRTSLQWRLENTWHQAGGERKYFFLLAAQKAARKVFTLDRVPGIGLVMERAPIPHVIPNDAPPPACGNPWTHVHVKEDGLVYPCCFSDEVMGDLRKQSFEEIWNGEKYQDLRRSLSELKPWASCKRASCNWINGSFCSDYGARIAPKHAVTEIDGSAGTEIALRIANTGRLRWMPPGQKKRREKDAPVTLSYRLFNEHNELVDEGEHVPVPRLVVPGESIEMTLRVKPVRHAGAMKLKIDMVHEGVTWFGERGNNAREMAVRVTNVPFAAYVGHADKVRIARTLDRVLSPHERLELPLRVTNVGTETLGNGDGRDFLSYHWRREKGDYVEWEGRRVALEGGVPPGGHVEVTLPVDVAPDETGRYELEIDVVRDGETWLSTAWGRPLLAYPARVAATTDAAALLPREDERGKLYAFEPRGQCVANTGNKGIW